jgi:negative regulator of sigma E activity
MKSPDPRSPIDPPEVDDITQRLSALLDGELEGTELIDVEQFAVDNETTIETLSGDLAASKSAVAALSSAPVQASTRSRHISAALDEMDAPEVKSLAAARAQRRTDDLMRQARAQQLNNRLRRLTAVAAVIAVVGGIGFVSTLGGLSGSDSSDEAATSGGDAFDTAASVERDATGSSDDGAGGDGSLAGDPDQTLSAAEESYDDSAQSGADDAVQSGPAEPIVVSESVDLADATLSELPDEILQRSSMAPGSAAPVIEAVCFDAAAQVVPGGEIVEGIIIQQGDSEFELVILLNEELLIFQLPQCVQVD